MQVQKKKPSNSNSNIKMCKILNNYNCTFDRCLQLGCQASYLTISQESNLTKYSLHVDLIKLDVVCFWEESIARSRRC